MKKILMFFVVIINLAAKAQQKLKVNNGKCSNPCITSEHTHHGSKGKTYTYEYNLENWNPNEDCFIKPRHLKDIIFIKIININRLAYQVKILDSTYSITLSNISLFDSLVNQLASSSLAKSDTHTIVSTNNIATVRDTELRLAFSEFMVRGGDKMTDPFFTKKQKIVGLQQKINSEYVKLLTWLKELEKFADFGKNLPILIGNECCNMIALQTKIERETNIQNLFSSIVFKEISNALNRILSKIDFIKSSEQSIKDDQAAIKVLIEDIKKSCKESDELPFIFCNTDDLELDKYPKDLSEVMKSASQVNKKKIAEAITGLQNLLAQAGNAQNFTFLSEAFRARGDELIIRTSIEPLNTSDSKLYKRSITHNLPVKGRFEWAIGPTLTFHISESLFDQTFSIDTTKNFHISEKPDSGKYLITKNNNRTKLAPSLGLMANFYWQNHSSVTPGIAIGLATSSANLSEIRAYLGGSLLVGGLSEKLLFNLGLAFGSVNRLKPNLNEGLNSKNEIPFNGDKVGAPADLVEKVFRAGIFFGFSYKLNN